MAKKVVERKVVKAPKGLELKAESKAKLQTEQIRYAMGDTKRMPSAGSKAAINGFKVHRAFKLGKNSKGDKSLL